MLICSIYPSSFTYKHSVEWVVEGINERFMEEGQGYQEREKEDSFQT